MSYLEFLGTLSNFISVYLLARGNILNWPIGNLGAILFLLLFYQLHLYSEMIQQLYFFIIGFYGWWMWLDFNKNTSPEEKSISMGYLSHSKNILYFSIILMSTMLMGYAMSHANSWFPQFFLKPASFPYTDAFITSMSFVALMLMTHKKIEGWYLWIAIDLIAVSMYCLKGVMLMALLYMFLLIMVIKGALYWRKQMFTA